MSSRGKKKKKKLTFDSIEDPTVQGFPAGVTGRGTDACATAVG